MLNRITRLSSLTALALGGVGGVSQAEELIRLDFDRVAQVEALNNGVTYYAGEIGGIVRTVSIEGAVFYEHEQGLRFQICHDAQEAACEDGRQLVLSKYHFDTQAFTEGGFVTGDDWYGKLDLQTGLLDSDFLLSGLGAFQKSFGVLGLEGAYLFKYENGLVLQPCAAEEDCAEQGKPIFIDNSQLPPGDFWVVPQAPHPAFYDGKNLVLLDSSTGVASRYDLSDFGDDIHQISYGGLVLGGEAMGRIDSIDGGVLWKRRLNNKLGTVKIDDDGWVISDKWFVKLNIQTGEREQRFDFQLLNLNQKQISRLADFGITDVDRFNRGERGNFVNHIIKNRQRLEAGDLELATEKPVAVIFSSRGDYNGALSFNNYQQLTKHYNVLYFEMSHELQLFEAVKKIASAGIKSDLVVLEGHGTQLTLQLGEDEEHSFSRELEWNFVDMNDRADLENLPLIVKKGGSFVLNSCSTGQGKNNLATLMAETIARGEDVKVYAPFMPTNSALSLDEQGRFESIMYTTGPKVEIAAEPAFIPPATLPVPLDQADDQSG